MMIKKDGKISIIAGRESFRSAFLSNDRKVRNAAHKKLISGMHERGYYSNGKRRQFPVLPKMIFDPEHPEKANWTDMSAGLEGMVKVFTKSVEDLSKPQEPLEFWGNPDTGQRIPVETLMIATDFWPLDEVLEMVPNK
jgi:hypothetical protein